MIEIAFDAVQQFIICVLRIVSNGYTISPAIDVTEYPNANLPQNDETCCLILPTIS